MDLAILLIEKTVKRTTEKREGRRPSCDRKEYGNRPAHHVSRYDDVDDV